MPRGASNYYNSPKDENFDKSPNTYQDAVRYAIKGAEMAHHASDILQEANFYFEAGKVMERPVLGRGFRADAGRRRSLQRSG